MQQLSASQIFIHTVICFWPVWLGLAVIFTVSIASRQKTGLYGRIFDSKVAMLGLSIVLFWILTASFAELLAPFDPLEQFAALKRALPGIIEQKSGLPFLFGGDNLGRDLFSRMIYGSRFVLLIAPAATLTSSISGVLLGLPAGYFRGRLNTLLSFLANLLLAFPVILLFHLLVTPGVRETIIPKLMAGLIFLLPIIFFMLLFWSRYGARRQLLWIQLTLVMAFAGWIYVGVVFPDAVEAIGLSDLFPGLELNELNIFVAVVFASAPGTFHIVRGLTLDLRTRDYVAAAQTRGENPWYIMLWEILPNIRGPLIVDVCLRIGYTTILLGTLGFFGLGLAPESPDWGSMINQTRGFIRIVPTIVLPPTLALASLVLGLNLLADGLREESLKD